MCMWSLIGVGMIIFIGLIMYSVLIEKTALWLLGRGEGKVSKLLVGVYAMTMFWLVWWMGLSWFLYYGIIISFVLLVSVSTDVREKLIKNKVTYPAVVLGFIYALMQSEALVHLLGGLFIVIVFGVLLIIMPGKMGLGDIKLLIPVGFLVGIQGISFVLLVASVFGLVFSLGKLMITKKKESIPFGPFIVMGTLIVLVHGDEMQAVLVNITGGVTYGL